MTGKTFDTYLDMVSAYSVPGDKTFCPFSFPIQYAKAMAASNENARASDTTFKSDLAEIRGEVNSPVVILFDEANVLAKSRTHLEKLRNIFMNTPGFMLVLTGTPDLFPLMDEVFSPIIRQFKKVQVGRFKDRGETRDCIRKPLEKIGISDATEIFDFETYRDVREIHDLTGGKPYEVQLLCHVLFRRVQEKRAKQMKLDLSVLEDVRSELENTQDISARPILTKIKSLNKTQLSALRLFLECDGRSNFDQTWGIEYIFNGEKNWTRENLYKSFQLLLDKEIIFIRNEAIKFQGDDFDKIYTKYYAREQDVGIHFLDFSPELLFRVRLMSAVESVVGLDFSSTLMLAPLSVTPECVLEQMGCLREDGSDVFSRGGALVVDLYRLMMRFAGEQLTPVVYVNFSATGFSSRSLMYAEGPSQVSAVEECLQRLSPLAQRASELEFRLKVQRKEFPVIPLETLAKNIERSGNERLRKSIGNLHYDEMRSQYLEKRDEQRARFHADFIIRYDPTPDARRSNDLGYFLLTQDDQEGARQALLRAVEAANDNFGPGLPLYNLAMLDAKAGNYEGSLNTLSASIEQVQTFWRDSGGL